MGIDVVYVTEDGREELVRRFMDETRSNGADEPITQTTSFFSFNLYMYRNDKVVLRNLGERSIFVGPARFQLEFTVYQYANA